MPISPHLSLLSPAFHNSRTFPTTADQPAPPSRRCKTCTRTAVTLAPRPPQQSLDCPWAPSHTIIIAYPTYLLPPPPPPQPVALPPLPLRRTILQPAASFLFPRKHAGAATSPPLRSISVRSLRTATSQPRVRTSSYLVNLTTNHNLAFLFLARA
ncbi:hypothetical protein F4801DRAFT_371305 [Xylaria longipes]|nr:hypothetical protein F4801DRAFT_371305 [Xylaria longipes]